jgi:hypothetical protein
VRLLRGVQRRGASCRWCDDTPPLFLGADELRHCSGLRRFSLEANRLTTPVIDLRAFKELVSLNLYGNPLELLPEVRKQTSGRSYGALN